MSLDFLLCEYSLLYKVVLKIRRNNVCETLQVILAAVAALRLFYPRLVELDGWLVDGFLFLFLRQDLTWLPWLV